MATINDVVLEPAERESLVALARERGHAVLASELGVSDQTLRSALAGAAVRRATVLALRVALQATSTHTDA